MLTVSPREHAEHRRYNGNQIPPCQPVGIAVPRKMGSKICTSKTPSKKPRPR